MKTLTEIEKLLNDTKIKLKGQLEQLFTLEQKLTDNTCEHGKIYLQGKLSECEQGIKVLENEISILEKWTQL